MRNKSRIVWDAVRKVLVYAAAGLTMLLLIGIIGYVLYKGLPS